MATQTPPLPSVSIIVPTFQEADNIPLLLERLAEVRQSNNLDMELWLMDDNSNDGSTEAVEAFNKSTSTTWAQIIVRTQNPGLSPSVVDGLKTATKEMVLVMDADLSHPPEKIPEMLRILQAGLRFVIGSRYVKGGSTDDDWGFFRWLNSRVATLLSRPLTKALDPMAGFFAMRRDELDNAAELNPIGYKIGLELIVKCKIDAVVEIPIHFQDRVHGESKLTLKQQLLYLQHLYRLYVFKFGTWSHFVQFILVGGSGVVVNLVVLTLLLKMDLSKQLAIAAAILISMVSNFVLNRRFTFSYAREGNVWKQFAGFMLACSFGAGIQYGVTLLISDRMSGVPIQLAALAGVASGMIFNFLVNRFVVFRQRHIRPKND